jgi:xanthine dehydrogenase accessory factor
MSDDCSMLNGDTLGFVARVSARQLGYHVTVAAPAADLTATLDADMLIDG